jgi:pyruvate dehydrogenase E2 component (dihydrolipoamide acetyltransferase)
VAPAPAAASVPAVVAAAAPLALGPADELVSLSMIRRTAAKRLVEAKQTIPHFYLTSDAGVDALWQFREQLNQAVVATGGDKVSVNDLVLKALARALRVVPAANMSLAGDGQNAIQHHRIDISVAVSLGDGEGLITPVVRSADQKSVGALSREVRELAQRGRDKKLRPEEYSGGTFSLTNLGMFGIREFFAIVNPPESGILAVGRVEKRPVVSEKDGRDEVKIERRLTLTLSCDHRIIDGALGAHLLSEVVRGLEQPLLLVL